MNIVLVNADSVLRIGESPEPVSEDTRMVLQRQAAPRAAVALDLAQLESLSRPSEADWGELLDSLTVGR